MIKVDVRSNVGDARRRMTALRESVQDQAVVRALNRTLTTVRAAAQREIRKEYPGLRAGTVREELKIRRATRAVMNAKITVQGRRMPLIDFAASQTRRGVSVRIKGQRKRVDHAFITTLKSGHKGVFVRAPNSKAQGSRMNFRIGVGSRLRKRGHDLPIAELTSIGLPRAFNNQKVQQALNSLARSTFLKNLQAEINYRTARGH